MLYCQFWSKRPCDFDGSVKLGAAKRNHSGSSVQESDKHLTIDIILILCWGSAAGPLCWFAMYYVKKNYGGIHLFYLVSYTSKLPCRIFVAGALCCKYKWKTLYLQLFISTLYVPKYVPICSKINWYVCWLVCLSATESLLVWHVARWNLDHVVEI